MSSSFRVIITLKSGECLFLNCSDAPTFKKDDKGVLTALTLPGSSQRIVYLDLKEVAAVTVEGEAR